MKLRETTEVLAIDLAKLRDTLVILGSIAKGADLPALVFLMSMAELEAVQAELMPNARRLPKSRRITGGRRRSASGF
jgi:hypothetical protein